MSRARSQTPAAVFLTNVGGAAPAQLGPADNELGRGGREDDSFPSLSPGSQAFSLTGVASAASSSVSTFLSFIFTRRASISCPTEGICRGGGRGCGGARLEKMRKTYKCTTITKKRQIFDTLAWRLVKLLKRSGIDFPPNSSSVLPI